MGGGAAALGAVIAGWGVSTAVATVIAGAVVGAAIGAVVGGLVAAVSGGSVGKGMLFGAVGGAVTGGLGAALGGGGSGTSGAAGSGSSGSQVAVGAGANGVHSSYGVLQSQFAQSGAGSVGSGSGSVVMNAALNTTSTSVSTASFLEQIGSSVLSEGAKAGIAAYLKKDSPQDWRTTKEGAMYLSEQELEKQRIASAGSRGGGGGAGHDPANMASVNLNREKWQEEVATRNRLQAARSENFAGLNTQRGVQAGDLVTDKGVWETKQDRQQAQALGEGDIVAQKVGESPTTQAALPVQDPASSTNVTTNVTTMTDRTSTDEAKAAMAL